MSIEVSCECAMTYRLPDRFAGKRCRCRECGDSIRVPTLDENDESDDVHDSDVHDSDVDDSDVESESGSRESGSHDEEESDARPAKATKKPPVKAPIVKSRIKSQPSESIHQMSPLNLSESRCIDPPAARARIKKAKAAAATINAKKRAALGPQSESEIDTVERPSKKKKEKLEKKAKKGGKSSKKDAEAKRPIARRGRRDDDADEDEDEDERPKKKGKKAAAKAEKKLGKKRGKADADESDAAEAEGDEGEEKPKLSPRQQKRRQQILILGGSFGALIAVAILFVVVNAVSASRKEAREKKFADSKAKVAAARELARTTSNLADAEKAYADALAFVQDESTPLPEETGDFAKDVKTFQAEAALFKQVGEARNKLSSDPGAAFDQFNGLVGAANDVIRELGLQGLIQTNDSRIGQICLAHANSPIASIKALARRGVVQFPPKDSSQLLATILREEGATGALGKLVVDRALDPRNEDPILLLAVAEKDTDAQHLSAALNAMSKIGDLRFKEVCEKLTHHPSDEVSKLASRVLDELKGQEKVANKKG